MSFINKKITSPANDGLSVFINKFIDNITTDSNYIDLIETNIDTKEDSEVWYIKFLLYGKIIIKMQQASNSGVNAAKVLLCYSINDGANFTDLNSPSWSVSILNNNIYEIDYLLVENPLCCYLDIIQYSINYLYSTNSSGYFVNFLSINKNDKVLITGGNISIDYKLNSSNTNFLCYNEATNYKLYNGLGDLNFPSKIFCMPKIITSGSSSTQKYVFSCDDCMLDVNLVEKFSKLIINGLKYFSLSSNTLIQYE